MIMRRNTYAVLAIIAMGISSPSLAMRSNKPKPTNKKITDDDIKKFIKSRHFDLIKNSNRPKEYPLRDEVTESLAGWGASFPIKHKDKKIQGYWPSYFVDGEVLVHDKTKLSGGWADPEDITKIKKPFSSLFVEEVKVDDDGRPLNPFGRTGLKGRGTLGRWGTNFAADPIITRRNPETGKIEMLAIIRGDTHQWAIPGGMVEEGEAMSRAAGRELKEETGADINMDDAIEIYKGYSADHRNTDNAWVETTVMHKHLPEDIVEKMELKPMDPHEVAKVQWSEVNDEFLSNLFASHKIFIKKALQDMGVAERVPKGLVKKRVEFYEGLGS